MRNASARLYSACGAAAALLLTLAIPAQAQYKPRPVSDPATGETFHIEAGASFWIPSSTIVVESAGSGALTGIGGTEIDTKRDLGFVDKRFPEFDLVIRPAPAHKIRLQYVPISFKPVVSSRAISCSTVSVTASAFRLIRRWTGKRSGSGTSSTSCERTAGLPVLSLKASTPTFKSSWRARASGSPNTLKPAHPFPRSAESDAFTSSRIFRSPASSPPSSFPTASTTARHAHYYDLDIYGTVNLTNNIGFKGGYRSLNLGYVIKQDTGALEMKGIYFGVVARY